MIVLAALRAERSDEGGDQRLVGGGLARHADGRGRRSRSPGGRPPRGVWKSGPISTSKPISAKAVAMTLARAVMAVLAELDHQHARPPPLLAREGLDLALDAAISPRRPGTARHRRPTPSEWWALWRVNTASSASEISPTVDARPRRGDRQLEQIALAAPGGFGQRLERGGAGIGVAVGAEPRQPGDLLLAHLVVSTSRRLTSEVSPLRYLLTPTMTCSPRSMAAWRRAAAASMRSFGMPLSTALVMPPSASTSWISAQAASATECVRLST